MDRLWFTGSGSGVAIMTDSVLGDRLLSFIESEGRSCSFDPGLITPEYVYRMWGGQCSIEEIEHGLIALRKTRNYGSMTPDKRRLSKYNVAVVFLKTNKRNPSKHIAVHNG